MGLADNRLFDKISWPSKYTLMVSPSISPLSYILILISSLVTVNACANSFFLDLVTVGIVIVGLSAGFSIMIGPVVFLRVVSVLGFVSTVVGFLAGDLAVVLATGFPCGLLPGLMEVFGAVLGTALGVVLAIKVSVFLGSNLSRKKGST